VTIISAGVGLSVGLGADVPHHGLLCALGDDHNSLVGGFHDDVQVFLTGLPDDVYINQSDATSLSSSQSSPLLYHIPPDDGV
jgi:hypothetical protein